MSSDDDYIPESDEDFDAWMDNFLTYARANIEALGLTEADLAPIEASHADWKTAYAAHLAADAAAKEAQQLWYQGTRSRKIDPRETMDGAALPFLRQLEANSALRNLVRQTVGINLRTVNRPDAPTSRPIATLDASVRLQHRVSFADEKNPGNQELPQGIFACEIWIKIGNPSPAGPGDLTQADASEFTYRATGARSPYFAGFDAEEGGQAACYMLRWVNIRGEHGPWSQTVSGTIKN
jgi:hypothetical protein